MSTLTVEQEASIREFLDSHPDLAVGVGTEERACSIASINLALTGTLTDTIPPCMSEVIGKWIIVVQDAMPAEIRNSAAWRAALVDAAGTGRKREQERLDVLLAWMWEAVLPHLLPLAIDLGFNAEWIMMLTERTPDAARAAAEAAAEAAEAAEAAAARAAAAAAAEAAEAAEAARAARAAWASFDPVGVLRALVEA